MTAAGAGVSVTIDDVWRNYGAVTAVGGVSLDVAAGEFVSLLGPSGSGKTTLLMILAGFEEPQRGRISVGGRDITHLPPNKRDVAMVFQRYALFPHMTVADNIGFPLRMRGVGRAERDAKIRQALETVKLGDYAGRKPAELSGGQQQRVALARAIVFDPPVILMDEPLGALDKKLRTHMQVEIKQLQQRLGATVIYVTHDQEEALTMSDRVAVMSGGELVQLGPPRALYERPANAFVADFIGEMNFLPGRLRERQGGCWAVEVEGGTVLTRCDDPGAQQGSSARVAVRPEHVALEAAAGPAGTDAVPGRLMQVIFNGATISVLAELSSGTVLRADMSPRSALAALQPGDMVQARWSPDAAHVFLDDRP